MTPEWVHPGLVLIVGAWLVPLLKGAAKRVVMILLPAVAWSTASSCSRGPTAWCASSDRI